MFTKEDVVLFSRVEGRILFEGKPASGAKIIRRYTIDTPSFVEDSCTVGEDGAFQLPVIIKKNVRTTPLVQFVVHQELYVDFNAKRFEIWLHGKMDKSENSEYGGTFMQIECELTKEPQNRKLDIGDYIYTNCVW